MKERKTPNTFLIWKKSIVYSDKEILNEYSSKIDNKNAETDCFFTQQPNVKCLNNSDKLLCEGALNRKECLDALKSMKGDKSPGTDGLPCEFYKVFWNDLVEILLNSLNYSYDIRKLSISQRRGIIKLIPKKDAELNLIKNWQPLTLLNCDYKIATKAIASRIKVVIPTLISDDQTGVIKGRFIVENIRLIDSFIKYTAERDMPGLLLFLDFEKAFDTLEWSFIQKNSRSFRFWYIITQLDKGFLL